MLRILAALGGAAVLGLCTACSAQPGPAPTVDPTPTQQASSTTPAPTPVRSRISVGVQPLYNGLNPHLLSDANATSISIADLVLPSAFVDGELNEDFLVSAEEIDSTEGAEQTLRYEIRPAAQWSDGTPITGSDFLYLWESMTATPAVVNAGPYQLIEAIRVSDAGKTVTIDLRSRIADWSGLFRYLMPSHLAGDGFADSFAESIPASGGRFMVDELDRSRGVITLHRNDRFWGQDTSNVDVVQLIEARSPTQAIELMRSGQVEYLDVVPSETNPQAIELLEDTAMEIQQAPRWLELSLSTTSPLLQEPSHRQELLSIVQPRVELIAQQANQRRSGVLSALSYSTPVDEPVLAELTSAQGLRIGADPADPEASAAARAIADVLVSAGINARVAAVDLQHMATEDLPSGELDAVVTWRHAPSTAVEAASIALCPTYSEGPWLSNLSGVCDEKAHADLMQAIAYGTGIEQVQAMVADTRQRHLTYMPIVQDNRMRAVSEAIAFEEIPDLSSIASWEKREGEEDE